MTQVSTPKDVAEQEAALATYAGEDRCIYASEIRTRFKNQPRNSVHFFSQLPGLDALTDGFQGGELIALSGPTKNGKTLLAQTLTAKFFEQGIKSLWFSFEVPMRQFLEQMPEDFMPKGFDFVAPNLLVPHKPDWLDQRIIESKLKFNTRAVFIDHLHYLVDIAKGGRNLSVDIGAIVRGLKRSAVRHNVVIFLLCHATKALGPAGEMRELGAFDIRDSSFVPQEADSTWIIQRALDPETDEYNDKAKLKVCNHRRTGVMEKRVTLIKRGKLFDEFEDLAKQVRELEADSRALPSKPVSDGGSGNDSLPF